MINGPLFSVVYTVLSKDLRDVLTMENCFRLFFTTLDFFPFYLELRISKFIIIFAFNGGY